MFVYCLVGSFVRLFVRRSFVRPYPQIDMCWLFEFRKILFSQAYPNKPHLHIKEANKVKMRLIPLKLKSTFLGSFCFVG